MKITQSFYSNARFLVSGFGFGFFVLPAIAAAGTAYVPSPNGNEITIIDTTTLTTTGKIPLNKQFNPKPFDIAFHPNGIDVYIANLASNSISIINAISKMEVASIPLAVDPISIAIHPTGAYLYVAGQSTNNVLIIDTATRSVIKTISVGMGIHPRSLAINPSGSEVYVANSVSNSISVIDTTTQALVFTISADIGISPESVAFNPMGRYAYVANTGSGNVSVIDTGLRRVVMPLPAPLQGIDAVAVGVDPLGSRLYVATNKGGTASVKMFDTATLTLSGVIQGPDIMDPTGVSVDPQSGLVYVLNTSQEKIAIVNPVTRVTVKAIDVWSPHAGGSIFLPTPPPTDMQVSLGGFVTDVPAGSIATGTVICANVGTSTAFNVDCKAAIAPIIGAHSITPKLSCTPAASMASLNPGTSIICNVSYKVPTAPVRFPQATSILEISGSVSSAMDSETSNNRATQWITPFTL